MAWYNPWGEIRTLKADLAEALNANSLYHIEQRDVVAQNGTQAKLIDDLRDKLWSMTVENRRLNSLMERAVFRDPDTGRLLPKGHVH